MPLGLYGRAGVALVSAWVAGYVDAVGYLDMVEVYTSHMSGNTAAIGQFLSRQQWHGAWKHGWPVLAFVAGLLAGAIVTEAARRRRLHSRMSLVLGMEILVLAPVPLFAPGMQPNSLYWLGLLALAMGMQTVTIMRVGDQRVYSTYVTGSLSKFAESLAAYGFWLKDQRPGSRHAPERSTGWKQQALRHRLLGHALLTFGLWALFLVGGLTGAQIELGWHLYALWCPIAALLLLIALDLWHPAAAVTENEPIGFDK